MYKLSQKAQKIHILSNFIIIILLSPKPALQAQYTHSILFKVQEYLCLAIFEKLIIQVHGKTILSIKFKSVIKTYGDFNGIQILQAKPMILSHGKLFIKKPNSHWQH